jgi:hypothetical protein
MTFCPVYDACVETDFFLKEFGSQVPLCSNHLQVGITKFPENLPLITKLTIKTMQITTALHNGAF